MNVITLDFSGVDSLWSLHEYLKEAFHLPDYYGRNMDALWDCLHCAFDGPTAVILRNVSGLPKELEKTAKAMLRLFHDLEREERDLSVRIETGEDTYSGIADFMGEVWRT